MFKCVLYLLCLKFSFAQRTNVVITGTTVPSSFTRIEGKREYFQIYFEKIELLVTIVLFCLSYYKSTKVIQRQNRSGRNGFGRNYCTLSPQESHQVQHHKQVHHLPKGQAHPPQCHSYVLGSGNEVRLGGSSQVCPKQF